MADPRFYTGPQKLEPGLVALSETESRHAASSRRLAVGDEVVLFDGRGSEARGQIESIDRRAVRVEIAVVESRDADAPVELTLAVSFPKGPRQDVLVEKCTELGVAAIWPMRCERSIAEPSAHRLGKLRRTVIEACKQSQRAWLCELSEPVPFAEVVGSIGRFEAAVIADGSADRSNAGGPTSHKSVLALVGPEGGFTTEELEAARDAGCGALVLGQTILRTETAAIAAAVRLLC